VANEIPTHKSYDTKGFGYEKRYKENAFVIATTAGVMFRWSLKVLCADQLASIQ